MKHTFCFLIIFATYVCTVFSMERDAIQSENDIQEIGLFDNQALSLTQLPDEMFIEIVMRGGIQPLNWPHVARTCKQFHCLFDQNGVISVRIKKLFAQTVPEFLQSRLETVNRMYEYGLFARNQEEIDHLHKTGEAKYVNPTLNLLPIHEKPALNACLTPLFWASLYNNVTEFKFLVEKIDKTTLNSPQVREQLQPIFVDLSGFSDSSVTKAAEFCEILGQSGFDFKSEIPKVGMPLMLAIRNKNIALLGYLLKTCNVDPNVLLPERPLRIEDIVLGRFKDNRPILIRYYDPAAIFVTYFNPLAYVLHGATDQTVQIDLAMAQLLINCGASSNFTKCYCDATGKVLGYKHDANAILNTTNLSLKSKNKFKTKLGISSSLSCVIQ